MYVRKEQIEGRMTDETGKMRFEIKFGEPISPSRREPIAVGSPCAVFLMGAGSDLATGGLNELVLSDGWRAFGERMKMLIATFFAGSKGGAVGRRVMVSLPFGRSHVESGPEADMPFDALQIMRSRNAALRRDDLRRATDEEAFIDAMTSVTRSTGAVLEFYLGTVDGGHRAKWASRGARSLVSIVETTLRPFNRVAARTGTRPRVWLDAAGVEGPSSNSWDVARIVGRSRTLGVGVEPWPSIAGRNWAADPSVRALVHSEFLQHVNPNWAVGRDEIRGGVDVLHAADAPATDDAERVRIARWLAAGFDVFVGAHSPQEGQARTHASDVEAVVGLAGA